MAAWQGVPYCLGTSSGHAALHSALIGLEVSWGDEVITTPMTFVATVAAIQLTGAQAVLADIERQLEHFLTGAYSADFRHPMG